MKGHGGSPYGLSMIDVSCFVQRRLLMHMASGAWLSRTAPGPLQPFDAGSELADTVVVGAAFAAQLIAC